MSDLEVIFNNVISKNNITILNTYTKLTKRTMIEFECKSCKQNIKKSVKLLLKYVNSNSNNEKHLTTLGFICSKCFRSIMY